MPALILPACAILLPLSGGLVADRLEFGAFLPDRPFPAIGQPPPEIVEDGQFLGHAGQVPIWVELVCRLVVAVARVRLLPRPPGGCPALDQILARLERDRRHALLGEREVVGAEE